MGKAGETQRLQGFSGGRRRLSEAVGNLQKTAESGRFWRQTVQTVACGAPFERSLKADFKGFSRQSGCHARFRNLQLSGKFVVPVEGSG